MDEMIDFIDGGGFGEGAWRRIGETVRQRCLLATGGGFRRSNIELAKLEARIFSGYSAGEGFRPRAKIEMTKPGDIE